MPAATILVVDDESLIRWTLSERLSLDGHVVVEAETGKAAIGRFGPDIDLVLLDFKLPDSDGLQVLKATKAKDSDVPVILLTAFSSIETAVEAMKQGAYHYANKPFNLDELAMVVQKALETTRLRREVRTLRASRSEPYAINRIIGDSEPMTRLKALLQKVASSPASTVLLRGESGTGKDLAAKTIHFNSDRGSRPFMNITCSALPDALLESELFGHERGAFTDVRNQKIGLLESADGGTVFLDEIGEMAPALQAKLLRVLEEKAFRRVGGTGDVRVDVRVIAATNRDLEEHVRLGKFRSDLYYRLNVLRLEMPPLRVRGQDALLLARHFVDVFRGEFNRPATTLSPATEEVLRTYGWPGNVRELRNLIERAVLLCESTELSPMDFESLRGMRATVGDGGFALPAEGVNLDNLERSLVVQALERTGGNQTRAAA